jgi:hypothetical protein
VRITPGAGPFAKNAVDVLRASERVVDGAAIAIAAADEGVALPALLFAPADPVRIGAANRSLERMGIPWRFAGARREAAVGRGPQLAQVNVSLRYQLAAQGAMLADTLATVGREPWIVAGPRYVLVASPLTADASTLPVSASFLPWLADVVSARLSGDPGTVRFAAPGETIVRPAGVDALEAGNGRRISMTGNSFEAPSAAGTYFLIEGSRRAGAIVVNPEVAESQLDRLSSSELRRITSPSAQVVDTPDAWTRLAFTGAARRSLVVPLLVAALIALIIESLIARGGGIRGSHASMASSARALS